MNKDKLKELIQSALQNEDTSTIDTGFSGRADYGEEDKALGGEDELEMKGFEENINESKGAANYFNDLKYNYQKAFRFLDVGEREEYKRLAKDFFSKLQVDDKVRAVGLEEADSKYPDFDLDRAGQMIQMLYRAVDKYDGEGEVDFPQWWQAKIIKANTMLDSAFDYLDGEEMVAKIDAMIDVDDNIEEGVFDQYDALPNRGNLDFNDILYLRGEVADLKDEIAQIYRDMEQEAEPEGGPVADMYGDLLNKAEAKLYRMQKQLDDYDMNESTVTESKGAANYFSDLKFNYQKAFKYDLGTGGSSIALGKETMTGQIRRESAAEAMRLADNVAKDLEAQYNLEDIEVTDLEIGKVQVFAVSDDFINIDPNMLGESVTIDKKISKLVKEKLTKSSSVEDHVEDFKDSDAPQFKGKSLDKIKKMALASFLSKQKK